MHNISNTLFFGKVLLALEEVGSTNAYAKTLLSKSKPIDGTAIFAYNQAAGRGQFGNKWQSAPGKNIIISLIVYPHFLSPKLQFKLNQAVSLGIRNFLLHYVAEASIKWPNDIYCDGKKIAGILIENQLQGTKYESAIIGIGLNINQTDFGELENATSLKMLTGVEYKLQEVLEELLASLEKYYLQLRGENFQVLDDAYTRSLYQLEQKARYEAGGVEFEGTITGINALGQLLVDSPDGQRIFNNQEVKYL